MRPAFAVAHRARAVRHIAVHRGAHGTRRYAAAAVCSGKESERGRQQSENQNDGLRAAHEVTRIRRKSHRTYYIAVRVCVREIFHGRLVDSCCLSNWSTRTVTT